jgi:iron complex outermembrane receptor protein
LRGSLSLGTASRHGFTTNTTTGEAADRRNASFGFAQLLWDDAGPWNARVSFTTETDRDGAYALGDLAALRAAPHRIAHDYRGSNRRELHQPVLTLTRAGQRVEFTSITSFQGWHTHDSTDADFSPNDLLRRGTAESQRAWTQELRLASVPGSDLEATPRYRWLVGVFAYTSRNVSDNFTHFRPMAASAQGVPVPFTQHDTARLRTTGVDPYAQLGLRVNDRLDVTLGLRYDYERKRAHLHSYFDPAIAPSMPVQRRAAFHQTSPQASLAYRLSPHAMGYASVSRGYKAGGFNQQAAAPTQAFGEETSWNYEAGLKSAWLHRRLTANLSVFHTTWDDIQLDVPTTVPAVFSIANAGKATSRGAELDLRYRSAFGLEVWGGAGFLGTEFGAGSTSAGVDVSGRRLPFAPPVTLNAGAQYSVQLSRTGRGWARVDARTTGRYYYDASNAMAQPGFTLVNARLGVERGEWRIEAWVNNLFNQRYIPVAFPVAIAPSGYLGECGPSRTAGIALGWALP